MGLGKPKYGDEARQAAIQWLETQGQEKSKFNTLLQSVGGNTQDNARYIINKTNVNQIFLGITQGGNRRKLTKSKKN